MDAAEKRAIGNTLAALAVLKIGEQASNLPNLAVLRFNFGLIPAAPEPAPKAPISGPCRPSGE